jgi:hypothetical protein
MIVRINSVKQAKNIFNMIAENEILRAVARICTEFKFDNIDGDHIDIDQVQCVAQMLVDIANSGLMTGYNGFIYMQDVVDFFNEHQQAISETLEQLELTCDFNLIEDEELTTNDVVAQTESFKSACVVRAVEYACAMFTSLIDK